jgi:hypothetical protein
MMDLVSSGRWKTVDVLSTTLDPTILAKLQTRSGRKSSVFPLPALHDIKRLFPEPIAFNLAVRLAGVIFRKFLVIINLTLEASQRDGRT